MPYVRGDFSPFTELLTRVMERIWRLEPSNLCLQRVATASSSRLSVIAVYFSPRAFVLLVQGGHPLAFWKLDGLN